MSYEPMNEWRARLDALIDDTAKRPAREAKLRKKVDEAVAKLRRAAGDDEALATLLDGHVQNLRKVKPRR